MWVCEIPSSGGRRFDFGFAETRPPVGGLVFRSTALHPSSGETANDGAHRLSGGGRRLRGDPPFLLHRHRAPPDAGSLSGRSFAQPGPTGRMSAPTGGD